MIIYRYSTSANASKRMSRNMANMANMAYMAPDKYYHSFINEDELGVPTKNPVNFSFVDICIIYFIISTISNTYLIII